MRSSKRFFWTREPRPPEIARCSGIRRFIPSKHEIERVKEVFAEHLRQSPDFELLWSDKVGYVWLTIGVNPLYVDTGIRIESAADLCGRCLDDVATDVLYMTGNDHALEAADPLELAEIKRRWEPYINQLPDYAYLCKDLLNGKM